MTNAHRRTNAFRSNTVLHIVGLLVATSQAAFVDAQVVRGRVIEDSTLGPVDRATVELLEARGRAIAKATADSAGRFMLRASRDGRYDLRVRRLGFAEGRLTAIGLTRDSIVEVLVTLQPIVATLAPTIVQATRQIFTLVRPAELGRRLITPERVSELAPRARSVEDYVLLQSIPGVSIYDEPPNIRCARLARGKPVSKRTALGYSTSGIPQLTYDLADEIGCMLMFVNNVQVEGLTHVDPNIVDLIVVLLPHEAGALYGTGASRGVLLVYTKGGVH